MTAPAQPKASQGSYPLRQVDIASYRENGFVQLDDVFVGEDLTHLQQLVEGAVEAERDLSALGSPKPDGPKSAYEAIFVQRVNLHRRHPALVPFVTSRRLGEIAERLAGRPMRLWHDQALFKEPEGDRPNATPWHQDAVYWPHSDRLNSLSFWIALSETTPRNGCMTFLPGSHRFGEHTPISLGNPADVMEIEPRLKSIKAKACPIRPGSCTVHNGLTFHYAGPNRTASIRKGFTVICMPADVRFTGGPHPLTMKAPPAVGAPFDDERFPIV